MYSLFSRPKKQGLVCKHLFLFLCGTRSRKRCVAMLRSLFGQVEMVHTGSPSLTSVERASGRAEAAGGTADSCPEME